MAADTVLTYLDSYCERAGQFGLFAEPLNLYTNLLFAMAAGYSVYELVRTHKTGWRPDLWLLAFFMFSIGVGSGMWHSMPNQFTVLMDVIPITLFINAYIISALRRLLQLSWGKTVLWWGLYFVAGIAAQKLLPADLLNGTIMYIPTYLALVAITWAIHQKDRTKGSIFGFALAVWTVSLIFRTMDRALCPSIEIGTHFLWHTLNAWVLWRLLKVLIDDSVMAVRRSHTP